MPRVLHTHELQFDVTLKFVSKNLKPTETTRLLRRDVALVAVEEALRNTFEGVSFEPVIEVTLASDTLYRSDNADSK